MAGQRTATIVLITDFGLRGPAVAQFKAGVLAVYQNVVFVDVTHEIRPRDILEAGFMLERIYRDFQSRTVFVVLVEPVLAAPKRPLLAVSMDYYYFAPDNGVLSFAFQSDPPSNVYHITADHLVKTANGPLAAHRDTYATAVGWLTKGLDSSNFGDPVTDHARLALPRAERSSPQELKGIVLQIEKHGGLVTNVHQRDIDSMRQEVGAQVPFRAVLGEVSVPVLGSWAEGAPEVFAVYGASGFLEIISAKGDASTALGIKRGSSVTIAFGG